MIHEIIIWPIRTKNQPNIFFLAIMPLDLHCKQLTRHILPPYSFQYVMPSHTNLHYVHKLLTIDSQIYRHTSSYRTLRIHTVGQVQEYSRKQYHLPCKLHHTNNHLKEDQSSTVQTPPTKALTAWLSHRVEQLNSRISNPHKINQTVQCGCNVPIKACLGNITVYF